MRQETLHRGSRKECSDVIIIDKELHLSPPITQHTRQKNYRKINTTPRSLHIALQQYLLRHHHPLLPHLRRPSCVTPATPHTPQARISALNHLRLSPPTPNRPITLMPHLLLSTEPLEKQLHRRHTRRHNPNIQLQYREHPGVRAVPYSVSQPS